MIKTISFFSGGGGLDLGLEGGFRVHKDSINTSFYPDYKDESSTWVRLKKNQFKTIFANDIEKKAAILWNKYFSEKENDRIYRIKSIIDLLVDWKGGKSPIPQDVDLVTGGFPCKDFSLAGKRLGFQSHKDHNGKITDHTVENNRGKLYRCMAEAIAILSPKMFIAENVTSMQSMEGVVEKIQSDFQNIGDGYVVLMKKFRCIDYGIPQTRERIFFFGISKKHYNSIWTSKELSARFSMPITHGESVKGSKILPVVPAITYLRDLKEPDTTTDPSQKKYSRAKWRPAGQGQNEIKPGKPGPTIRSEHHGNIEFRRLSAEHGGRHIEELKIGLHERRLTVRECARLQTFPDNYEFLPHISASASYKVIGNAVPPLLAFFIGKNIQKIWPEIFS